MRAGDSIVHKPTGDRYLVAAVEGDNVFVLRAPPLALPLAECEVTRAATDAEHAHLMPPVQP